MFLHGFQQGSLRLGSRTVDLVRQYDGGKKWSLLEAENISLFRTHQDIGTRDIRGHQIRCELNAGERQVKHLAQHPYQVGLAQSGHALQQHIASGDHSQQQVFHHVCLSDHFLCNLRPDLFILFREFLHGLYLFTHVLAFHSSLFIRFLLCKERKVIVDPLPLLHRQVFPVGRAGFRFSIIIQGFIPGHIPAGISFARSGFQLD